MPRHEEHVVARGQMRKQSAILNDVADAMAQLGDVLRRHRRAVEFDPAGVGLEQADDQAKKGRFAATARPDEHSGFTALEAEIEWLKGGGAAVFFADADELNQRAHRCLICDDEMKDGKQLLRICPGVRKTKASRPGEGREARESILVGDSLMIFSPGAK